MIEHVQAFTSDISTTYTYKITVIDVLRTGASCVFVEIVRARNEHKHLLEDSELTRIHRNEQGTAHFFPLFSNLFSTTPFTRLLTL
nr:AlNc14C120G6635 [Albugo laibachii Nc14]|eukprot:CCA21354.1 AlNc14C120G6635 [Albugo laibachii Nc14]